MTLTTRGTNSWSGSDLESLTNILTVLVKGQNAYGKQHNLGDLLAYMRFKLERKYTAEQVLYAIDQYTNRHDDIPTPADINNILDPEKPRITDAEFVEAQKWQDANGYPRFSAAFETIQEYKKQNSEARSDVRLPEKFMEIAAQSLKRIEG